jgi:transglutaminase-like putative cysteine protease
MMLATMTRAIRWAAAVGGILAASAVFVVRSHGTSVERVFELTYAAAITEWPEGAESVRIWIPLAKDQEHQRVRARRITTALPYEIHQDPVFGNDVLSLAADAPLPERIDVVMTYEASVRQVRRLPGPGVAQAALTTALSESERMLALRDEPFMVVNDEVRRRAREATVGQTTDLGRARAIYDHVISHMRYEKTTPGWGQGDTARACRLGAGNCTDFHSLFISMARAVGIPARFVIGVPIPQGTGGEIPGYHCWAEFHHPAYGWVPVDAAEAWKHPELRERYFGTSDPHRLLISIGRNIPLTPAQAGPPVNILLKPYVEVDGRIAGKVETTWAYRNLARNTQEEGG